MILSDRDIVDLCRTGGLVEPFIIDNVQPASIDLRLGNDFRVFVPHSEGTIDLASPTDITKPVYVDDDRSFVIHPGEFVLGVTMERVSIPGDLVGRVEGKSSLGRLGLIVHATAGYIDPGFVGRITLEMANLMRVPLRIYPGQLICQLSFHRLATPARSLYQGRYQGDMTVAASRFKMGRAHD